MLAIWTNSRDYFLTRHLVYDCVGLPGDQMHLHPRSGGRPWVRYRREAEDVLCEAGAAIMHLPDFYGPHVHVSTLQNALIEAAFGKTVNWLGSADTQREYYHRYSLAPTR
jgi:hypothetical protein